MRQRFRPGFWLLLFSMIAMSACTEQINYPAPTITFVGICPFADQHNANCVNSIAAGSAQAYLTIRGNNLIQQTQAGFTLSPGGGTRVLATNQYISTNEMIVTLPASLLQNSQHPLHQCHHAAAGRRNIPVAKPGAPTRHDIHNYADRQRKASRHQHESHHRFCRRSGLAAESERTELRVAVHRVCEQLQPQYQLPQLHVAAGESGFHRIFSLPAQFRFKVVNPPPGGGGSTPVSLSVLTAVPVISAVAPVSALAGATSASLSVTGSGFLNQYTYVTVNGQPVTTTIGGSSSATASLTAGDLVSSGVNQIRGGKQAARGRSLQHPHLFHQSNTLAGLAGAGGSRSGRIAGDQRHLRWCGQLCEWRSWPHDS